jgi:hypothetical protein
MTTSASEAIQEDYDFSHGYDVDVACSDCGDAAIVRFCNGEPVEESAMNCHCGGELLPV